MKPVRAPQDEDSNEKLQNRMSTMRMSNHSSVATERLTRLTNANNSQLTMSRASFGKNEKGSAENSEKRAGEKEAIQNSIKALNSGQTVNQIINQELEVDKELSYDIQSQSQFNVLRSPGSEAKMTPSTILGENRKSSTQGAKLMSSGLPKN